MSTITVLSILFLVFGILIFTRGFTRLQVRDKRYNKGIKKKFNWLSLVLFLISFICFYLAYRFFYYS